MTEWQLVQKETFIENLLSFSHCAKWLVGSFINYSQQPRDLSCEGIIIITVSHVRDRRCQEFKEIAQGHTIIKCNANPVWSDCET